MSWIDPAAEKAKNKFYRELLDSVVAADRLLRKPAPVDENWMRVAPGTDAAIWRPWSRETGEL